VWFSDTVTQYGTTASNFKAKSPFVTNYAAKFLSTGKSVGTEYAVTPQLKKFAPSQEPRKFPLVAYFGNIGITMFKKVDQIFGSTKGRLVATGTATKSYMALGTPTANDAKTLAHHHLVDTWQQKNQIQGSQATVLRQYTW